VSPAPKHGWMLTKNQLKKFCSWWKLREHKNNCKNMGKNENFRKKFCKNENFVIFLRKQKLLQKPSRDQKFFAKTLAKIKAFAKTFAKVNIFAKQNFAKIERILLIFAFCEIEKSGFRFNPKLTLFINMVNGTK
jgi:hypothetical protein